MSGPDLYRRVQLSHPGTKVLYTSGYTDDAIVHHGVLDPGTPFLTKPFSVVDLNAKLREVLDA
jgi:YesN/AraC family two-component response regulator